jgi:hypothetical protein
MSCWYRYLVLYSLVATTMIFQDGEAPNALRQRAQSLSFAMWTRQSLISLIYFISLRFDIGGSKKRPFGFSHVHHFQLEHN